MDQLHELAPSRPPPPPPIKTLLNGWAGLSNYVSIPDQSSPRSEGDGLLSPGSSCRSALSPTLVYSPFASSFNNSNNINNNLSAYNDRASPRAPPPLSPADLPLSTPFAASKLAPPVSSKPAAKPVIRPSQLSKLPTKPYKDEPEPDISTTNAQDYDDEEEEEYNAEDDEEIPELPPLIIITGANSGLGLAFFEHFSSCPPPPPPPPSSSSSLEPTTSLPVLPYDVIGIDKVPWRLPGQGFQWQTKIGTHGQYVQVDTTASAKRLDAWAEKWLYASVPVATSPSSGVGGSATQKKTKRYPRPVSLVLHCAEARGLVPEVEQQQLQQLQKQQQQQQQQKQPTKTKSHTTTTTTATPPISLSPTAAETLDVMTAETMRRTYDANVVGTLQLAQTVIPHMQLHAQFTQARVQDLLVDATEAGMLESTPLPEAIPPRLVMLGGGGGGGKAKERENENGKMSSKSSTKKMMMGSIKTNISGGGYAYRASKAALNAVVKSLSVDVPEVCFTSVVTGLADTSKKSGEIEDVVKDLLPLIEKLGTGSLTSGCFVDRCGESIDW